MRVMRGDPATWEPLGDGSAVAVGVFDGVHRGHRQVLSTMSELADAAGLNTVVLTFDPHPLAVVAPAKAPAMLTGIDHRIELLGGLAIDAVAVLDFDDRIRRLSPSAFVTETVSGPLAARLVCVGKDFRFGKDRAGDVSMLRDLGTVQGFDAAVVELVGDGSPVSSTRIRRMVLDGDVVGAAAALGRPHELWGEVIRGEGRGRTIGVPTANLAVPAEMAIPLGGVYAVTAGRSAGESIPAVVNIGTRPTFGGTTISVEAHLLDFDEDLYGTVLRVRFVERIRDERRFDGVDQLVAQIGDDIAVGRAILAG